MPSTGNSEITDSIAQVTTETVGNSAAVAVAYVYQSMAQAVGLAAYNATDAQQQGNILGNAVTAKGSQQILAIPVPTPTG